MLETSDGELRDSDSEERDKNDKALNAVLLPAKPDSDHHENGKQDEEQEDASENINSKLSQRRKVLIRAVKTKTLEARKKGALKKLTPLPSKQVLKTLRSRKQKKGEKNGAMDIDAEDQDDIKKIEKARKEREAQEIMELYPETGDMMKELKEKLVELNILQCLFCETVLNKNKSTLSQVLKDTAPWNKQRDSRETYVKIGKWLKQTDEEKLEQIKTSERRLPSKNLFGEDKFLDTVKLMDVLRRVLDSLGVSRYTFATQVLGVDTEVFYPMMDKKRSWDNLKSHRKTYWRCYEWMQKSDEEKISSIPGSKKTRSYRRSVLDHAKKIDFEELPEQLKNPHPDLQAMFKVHQNSKSLLTQLKTELRRHKIGQAVFFEKILGQKSDGVSRLACGLSWRQMMASNRSFNKLESFRMIHNWLTLPEEGRMALQADTRKHRKKRPAADMDTTTASQPEKEEGVKQLKRTCGKILEEETEVSQISAVNSAVITLPTKKEDSAPNPIQPEPMDDCIVREPDNEGLPKIMQSISSSASGTEEPVKQQRTCERVSEENKEGSQISEVKSAVLTPPTEKEGFFRAPTPIQQETVDAAIVLEEDDEGRPMKMQSNSSSALEKKEEVKQLKKFCERISEEVTEDSPIGTVKSAVTTPSTEMQDSARNLIQSDVELESNGQWTMQIPKLLAADMDPSAQLEEEGVKQLEKTREQISDRDEEDSKMPTVMSSTPSPPRKKEDSVPNAIQQEPRNDAIVREQANVDPLRKKINIWSLIHESGTEAWLDDPIMDMYLKDLCAKSEQYKQIDAPFYTKNGGFNQLIKDKMENEVAEVYFFPICHKKHWMLLTIYKDYVEYYDPRHRDIPLPVINFLFFLDKPLRPYDDDPPFQKDGFNCGVFCLLMAKSTVEGVQLTQEDADEQVRTFREDLEYKLVHSDEYEVTRDEPTPNFKEQAKPSTDKRTSRTSTAVVPIETIPAKKVGDVIVIGSDDEDDGPDAWLSEIKTSTNKRSSRTSTTAVRIHTIPAQKVDAVDVLRSDDEDDIIVIEPDDEDKGPDIFLSKIRTSTNEKSSRTSKTVVPTRTTSAQGSLKGISREHENKRSKEDPSVSRIKYHVTSPPTKKEDFPHAPNPIQRKPVTDVIVIGEDKKTPRRGKPRINIWSLKKEKGYDAYLGDEIMKMYLEELCTKSGKYKSIDSVLYQFNENFNQLIKDKMEEEVAEVYFFPICHKKHWTLLTIFEDHVKYYDSLRRPIPVKVNGLIRSLGKRQRPYDDKTPFQKDGFNCGVFCLLMAKSTVEGARLTQEDADEEVRTFRKELLKKLKNSDDYDTYEQEPSPDWNRPL